MRHAIGFLIVLFTFLSMGGQAVHAQERTAVTQHVTKRIATPGVERVLIIGSSVADGWRDVQGGYLKRAFRVLSDIDHLSYHLINRAIPGLGALRLNRYVVGWEQSSNAQIAVIAWGGLDDAHDHTPLPLFRDLIRQQIGTALANHMVVFVITPPISKASYTQYRVQQKNFLDAEMQVAHSFQNHNVYVFDVFDSMRHYLLAHDQTYLPYMADGWHPNTQGHSLAAQLLLLQMMRMLGTSPVVFDATGKA